MSYGPGFGLPDLMSPTSEIKQAVADLTALPKDPLRDGQLAGLEETLKIRLEHGAAEIPIGFQPAPKTARNE